jgi:hypothetical protein
MQEGEHNSVATGCKGAGDSLRHVLFVRGELYLAGRQHALGYAENPFARDERFRPHGIEIVDLRNFQACNAQHVLEVFGGEQRDLLAVALDDGVDADGGTMGEIGDVLRFDAVALFQRIEREKDFFSGRIGAGKHLQGGKRAGPIVEHGKIRKRPAHIDANAISHLFRLLFQCGRCCHRDRKRAKHLWGKGHSPRL